MPLKVKVLKRGFPGKVKYHGASSVNKKVDMDDLIEDIVEGSTV